MNLLKRLKVEVWFEACVVVGTGVWTVVGFGTGVVMNVSFAFADSLSCNGAQWTGTGTVLPLVDDFDVDISVLDGNIQPDIWYDSLSN